MNYQAMLQAVDTTKALKLINIEETRQGAYIKYPCHKCGKQAVIKAFVENCFWPFRRKKEWKIRDAYKLVSFNCLLSLSSAMEQLLSENAEM